MTTLVTSSLPREKARSTSCNEQAIVEIEGLVAMEFARKRQAKKLAGEKEQKLDEKANRTKRD